MQETILLDHVWFGFGQNEYYQNIEDDSIEYMLTCIMYTSTYSTPYGTYRHY